MDNSRNPKGAHRRTAVYQRNQRPQNTRQPDQTKNKKTPALNDNLCAYTAEIQLICVRPQNPPSPIHFATTSSKNTVFHIIRYNPPPLPQKTKKVRQNYFHRTSKPSENHTHITKNQSAGTP
ncbi:MAG: hypothetical protein D6706_19755 [Chloroflexi bacterium]|nr:MAG: hypothetical protein D6706_19755 [Chloroflexota bacterium]